MTDKREWASYTVAEVASYLRVPAATVRYWAKGQKHHLPLIEVPQPEERPVLLSFFNLISLHVLATIRRKYDVPMPKIRSAIDYLTTSGILNKQRDLRHPLVSKHFETDGLDLFISHYGQLINISQDGQMAMREVMSSALHRIERDETGLPVRLFPFTRSSLENAPSIIAIDYQISGGRPVIKGTGLATEIIAERYKAGDSVDSLTADYNCTSEQIEEAIRSELRVAA